MATYVGQRFQDFKASGSMGVVKDTTFWFCHWPKLDEPTALFAEGSRGLKVAGSSRNVIWPDDTEFLDYYPDALHPAERAVAEAFPGQRLGMVNLTPEMVEVYMAEYARVVADLPETAGVHATRGDVHFLRHRELVSAASEKPRYEDYIAELRREQVDALRADSDVEALKAECKFIPLNISRDKAETFFKVDPLGGLMAVEAEG